MKILASWVISAASIFITAGLVPGFRVDSIQTAFLVAVTLGFLNAILKPILSFLTLPITIVTLGLFTFIINAVILELAAFVISGFAIDNFFPTAVIAALVLSIISSVLNHLFR